MNIPKGLQLVSEFITSEEEILLLKNIDEQRWDTRLRRRTQHYGWIYDYTGGPLEKTTPFPSWVDSVIKKMIDEAYIKNKPDQLIINEYIPGQGIGAHTDNKQFEDTIISVSLNSNCSFQFKRDYTSGSGLYDIFLKPRTLVIMKGESRYDWKHQIPARKIDIVNGCRKKRERRVSLTFRYVPFDIKYNKCKKKMFKWIKTSYKEEEWKFFDDIIENAEETIKDIKNILFKNGECTKKRYEGARIWTLIRKYDGVKESMYIKYQNTL